MKKRMENTCDKKILVLVDDPATRNLFRETLSQHGCHLTECENSGDLVATVLFEPSDLIVIDLDFPDTDAIETIFYIRRQDRLSEIPLLAISSDGGRGIRLFTQAEKLGRGRIEYATKPLSAGKIENLIREFLPVREKAA